MIPVPLPRLALVVVIAAAATSLACQTDAKKPEGPGDAGATAVASDAGSFGAHDAGTSTGAVDGGVVANASSDAGVSSSGAAHSGRPTAGTPSSFDRVLAKPKDAALVPDAAKRAVEERVGVPVASVRKTAGKWLLFTFAPPPGGTRTGADQQKLVDALTASGLFEAVEADRLMQVK